MVRLCSSRSWAQSQYTSLTLCVCLPSMVCSKALSQRVSVYSKKLVGEQDALAVEVRVCDVRACKADCILCEGLPKQ